MAFPGVVSKYFTPQTFQTFSPVFVAAEGEREVTLN